MDPAALRFAFRPLWQLSAAEQAGVALQKAQATAVYAGLNLWPVATTAALVRSQLLEDGVYPGAGAAFAADTVAAEAEPAGAASPQGAQAVVADYSPDQPRNERGEWTSGGGTISSEPQAKAPVVAPAQPGASAPSGLGRALSEFESHAEETHQQNAAPDAETQLVRAVLNPLLVPLAAHQAIRTVLQTITNLFTGKTPEPAEAEPPGSPVEGTGEQPAETEGGRSHPSPTSKSGQNLEQPSSSQGSGSPAEETASTWESPASLARHFAKHGAEFDAATAEDYAQKASQFSKDAQARGFLTKIDADGTTRVYDPETNSFGAFNPDGTTRTFFKPSSRAYFDRQPGTGPNSSGRMK